MYKLIILSIFIVLLSFYTYNILEGNTDILFHKYVPFTSLHAINDNSASNINLIISPESSVNYEEYYEKWEPQIENILKSLEKNDKLVTVYYGDEKIYDQILPALLYSNEIQYRETKSKLTCPNELRNSSSPSIIIGNSPKENHFCYKIIPNKQFDYYSISSFYTENIADTEKKIPSSDTKNTGNNLEIEKTIKKKLFTISSFKMKYIDYNKKLELPTSHKLQLTVKNHNTNSESIKFVIEDKETGNLLSKPITTPLIKPEKSIIIDVDIHIPKLTTISSFPEIFDVKPLNENSMFIEHKFEFNTIVLKKFLDFEKKFIDCSSYASYNFQFIAPPSAGKSTFIEILKHAIDRPYLLPNEIFKERTITRDLILKYFGLNIVFTDIWGIEESTFTEEVQQGVVKGTLGVGSTIGHDDEVKLKIVTRETPIIPDALILLFSLSKRYTPTELEIMQNIISLAQKNHVPVVICFTHLDDIEDVDKEIEYLLQCRKDEGGNKCGLNVKVADITKIKLPFEKINDQEVTVTTKKYYQEALRIILKISSQVNEAKYSECTVDERYTTLFYHYLSSIFRKDKVLMY